MFFTDQRWYSQGEPELGLGIVIECQPKRITISFPLSGEERIYSTSTHPLKRFTLEPGDKILHPEQGELTITEVFIKDELSYYQCSDIIVSEIDLPAKIDLNGPLERLVIKSFDSEVFSRIRYNAYLGLRKYQEFKYKGLLSPKIRLLPHQVYVVSEILNMDKPKVMLCDEVGLGKTIQACMVLNSLIQTNRVEKTLIIVPDSLVNQWFVELYKKFNIPFKTLHNANEEFLTTEDSKLIIGLSYLRENPHEFDLLNEIGFDALILDEAHQLNFVDNDSDLIKNIRKINESTFLTLLLSATPEVLGTDHLFKQLNFLDPFKYNSSEDFQKLIDTSHKISKLILQEDLLNRSEELTPYISQDELKSIKSSQELRSILIDRYGTGRNYFRNSRKNLERFSKLFNKRILHQHPLSIEGKINDKSVFEAKLSSVYEIFKNNNTKKILIICHSKSLVIKLQKAFLELENIKLATFHSDQTIMERDRQAAYFADEDGARILISTEVGSEGRNFEFADQLVLFDLPKLPDQLEQRIGRLDRIGQENNINIHVPYVLHTFEEIIFTWYHKVLNSFESSPPGANSFYESSHDELIHLLETGFEREKLNDFIDNKATSYQIFKTKLEEGKDLLIENNSYNDSVAKEIISTIEKFESSNPPSAFFDEIANAIGINIEELSSETFFAKPSDNLLIPSFAGLSSDGLSLSIHREVAIKLPHIELLSWEHPLIKSSFDLILNSPLGNCVYVVSEALPQDLYFEFILSLQTVDESKFDSAIFLPFTPIRVLMNTESTDKTKAITKKFLDSTIAASCDADIRVLEQIPKEFLTSLFRKSLQIAQMRSKDYKEKSLDTAKNYFEHEINRIKSLSIESTIKSEQITSVASKKDLIISSISSAKLQVDSIRIILGKN